MRRVTKAIARRIKLNENKYGETLADFIKEAGLRYGFDISKYNATLEKYGICAITSAEFDKAKAIKTKYYLVSEEDMKRLTLLITNMLEEYKEPPYRKQWQEFNMWISNGKFKIIKK